jgi:hypothetical protein
MWAEADRATTIHARRAGRTRSRQDAQAGRSTNRGIHNRTGGLQYGG